jgi:hypothetical protein
MGTPPSWISPLWFDSFADLPFYYTLLKNITLILFSRTMHRVSHSPLERGCSIHEGKLGRQKMIVLAR